MDKILTVSDISEGGTILNNVITWTFDTFSANATKKVTFKAKIPTTITEEMIIENVGKAKGTNTLEKSSDVVETKVEPNTPPPPTPDPDPGNVTPVKSGTAAQTGDAVCILGLALVAVLGMGIAISLQKRSRKNR